MDMLTLKESKALTAATGALWKCARSVENAKRYVDSTTLKVSGRYSHKERKRFS